MNREDRKIAAAVANEIPSITRAVEAIVRGLQNGGRLFYVGAGTSGRLGVLDAAECPPTFGIPPRMIHALIAGGRRAVTDAVEGAEDAVGLRADAVVSGVRQVGGDRRGGPAGNGGDGAHDRVSSNH